MKPCAKLIIIHKDRTRLSIDVYNPRDVKRMADTCRALPNVRKVLVR